METWRQALRADPLPWLLEHETPAVRHLALTRLLDEPEDAREVRRARAAAMRTDPAHVLSHAPAVTGGFGASGRTGAARTSPSEVLHCLNGNLLRATVAFGFLDDPRVRRAIDREVAAISDATFEGFRRSGTTGPGFACAINEALPCGWGAVKALRGLAAIPPRRRGPKVRAAIERGVGFLLSVDPATARYPMGWGNTIPNRSWFKLGFPSGYVADVLQVLEVLAELGHGRDPRLGDTIDLVLGKQDREGRWRNEYPYRGKLWADVDEPRGPSKWVTLRACAVLKAAA
jgi:hypothetical protein